METQNKTPIEPLSENQRVSTDGHGRAQSLRDPALAPAAGQARGASPKRDLRFSRGQACAVPGLETGPAGGQVENMRENRGAGGSGSGDAAGTAPDGARAGEVVLFPGVRIIREAGGRPVGPQRGLPRQDEPPHVASTCANWDDGHCASCGSQSQGFEVSPTYRCPYWNPR